MRGNGNSSGSDVKKVGKLLTKEQNTVGLKRP